MLRNSYFIISPFDFTVLSPICFYLMQVPCQIDKKKKYQIKYLLRKVKIKYAKFPLLFCRNAKLHHRHFRFQRKKSDGTESPCLTLKNADKCKFASKSCFFALNVRLRNGRCIREKTATKKILNRFKALPFFPLFSNSTFIPHILFTMVHEQGISDENPQKKKKQIRKNSGERKSILYAKNRRKSHFRRFYSLFRVSAPLAENFIHHDPRRHRSIEGGNISLHGNGHFKITGL